MSSGPDPISRGCPDPTAVPAVESRIRLGPPRLLTTMSSEPTAPARHLNCIVPPHLLEAIARNGTPAQQQLARETLTLDTLARDARSGPVAEPLEPGPLAGPARRSRAIHDGRHGAALPGTPVRGEGDDPTGDVDADRVYDGFGATWDLYSEVYGRNSFDDAGATLIGTVHHRVQLQQRVLERHPDGVRRRRRHPVRELHRRSRRDGPRTHPRGDRAELRPGVPPSARCPERVDVRRLRFPGQAAHGLPDDRPGRLADRSRHPRTVDPGGGAALHAGTRHGVRRPDARQGPAAGPHGRLRRHHRGQRRGAHQLGHPEPGVLPLRHRAGRLRLGAGRAGLVCHQHRPGARLRRLVPAVRGPDRDARRRPVRRGRCAVLRRGVGRGGHRSGTQASLPSSTVGRPRRNVATTRPGSSRPAYGVLRDSDAEVALSTTRRTDGS